MEEEKITYEFTKEEINILWEMVDVCLKVGGLKNLAVVNKMYATLQKPVVNTLFKSNIPESTDVPKDRE